MDIRREGLIGYSGPEDRLWIIGTADFEAALTDYNWEITGYDKRLHQLFPDIIRYSGNAYYVTGAFASQNGWVVTRVEDRR